MSTDNPVWGAGILGLKKIFKTKTDIAEMISKTKWSNSFNWYEIDKLANYFDVYQVSKNEIIFHQGTIHTPIGLIIQGQVGIYKEDSRRDKKLLASLSQGAAFGEMSMIDKEPTSASAIAAVSSILLLMTREQFDSLIKNSPALAARFLLKMAQMISQRLRKTSGELIDLIEQDDADVQV